MANYLRAWIEGTRDLESRDLESLFDHRPLFDKRHTIFDSVYDNVRASNQWFRAEAAGGDPDDFAMILVRNLSRSGCRDVTGYHGQLTLDFFFVD